MHAALSPPSDWIVRWSHLVPPRGSVLDVACGSGRHLRWFAERGHSVTGVDIQIPDFSDFSDLPETRLVQADIENQPWPFAETALFDAVVVTNYLHRPLFPLLLQSLKPNGVLLYETFAEGNAEFGRPRRPEFLLQPNELLQVCAGMHIIAYENGYLPNPPRCVQRVVALKAQIGNVCVTINHDNQSRRIYPRGFIQPV